MSDEATPAEQTTAAPQPPIPPSTARYYFVGVPDRAGEPVKLMSDDLGGLLKAAYAALVQLRSGWAYFFIDGHLCALSQPQQIFQLKQQDGRLVTIADDAGPVFDASGRFYTLQQ